jgi:hypothetical protein
VPIYRHRDAWAVEVTSPSPEAWALESTKQVADSSPSAPSPSVPASPAAKTFLARPAQSVPQTSTSAGGLSSHEIPHEVLVVVSKLKAYIKARGDMNCSADVMDTLSDKLRRLCDDAILHARQDGRKTVMARDF